MSGNDSGFLSEQQDADELELVAPEPEIEHSAQAMAVEPEPAEVKNDEAKMEAQDEAQEEKSYNIYIEAASKAKINTEGNSGIIPGIHKKHAGMEQLRIMNVHPSRLAALVDQLGPQAKFHGTVAERDDFFSDIAMASFSHGDLGLEATLYREGADWHRSDVSDDGRNIVIGSPNLASRKGLGPGEKTAARVSQSFGLGRTISMPLWQSGIWFTLKAPLLADELELDRRIAADRVLLGRDTHGAAFSNDGVIINRPLVDFIFKHTLDTSIGAMQFEDWLDAIKLPDLYALALGMACTIHVNGFPFRQPCITNIETCTHIEKATLNLPKLHWVDRAKVTPKQRRIMGKRGSRVSQAELDAYQEEFSAGAAGSLKLNDAFTVVFKTPSLAEHFAVGEAWVSDLTAAADYAFGTNMSVDERNQYLYQQAKLSKLRTHSHWIDKIVEVVDTPNGDIEEEHLPGAALENILTQLSGDDEVVEKIVEAIHDYFAAILISVVGFPNYDCPKCGAFHTDVRGVQHAIHALDPVSVFFQMQQFRLRAHLTQEG